MRAFAAVAIVLAIIGGGCDRPAKTPAIALVGGSVEARGLDSGTVRKLRGLGNDARAWEPYFSISVGAQAPPVAGSFGLQGDTARFRPVLPLDPGRDYQVRLVTGDGRGPGRALITRLKIPAQTAQAQVRVEAVYPSGEVWPQNLLRLYLVFSGPMEPRAGELRLLDEDGRTVEDSFLPLGYEFWSPDRTRLTVLLDPGRVKRGIVAGAVLRQGKAYALVVGSGWKGAHGEPVAGNYRRAIRVGPPIRTAIEPGRWKIAAPPKGSLTPVRVELDRPFDYGLLMSSLGVASADGSLLAGRAEIGPGERQWSFIPSEPWAPRDHHLVIRPWLEDVAGNRPGLPFEAKPAKGKPGRSADPDAPWVSASFRPS